MNITVDKGRVDAFCIKHKIKKLMFFGSVLRNDFKPESDIDALVEFENDIKVGMIALAGLEMELSDILCRRVELHTLNGINPQFKKEVISNAEVQFEQKG